MKSSHNEIFTSIPDVHTLWAECGYLGGICYTNRAITYLRIPALGQREVVVVANGRVVEHYFTNAHGTSRRNSEGWIGNWAWGLSLKTALNFTILETKSLAEYIHQLETAAQSCKSLENS